MALIATNHELLVSSTPAEVCYVMNFIDISSYIYILNCWPYQFINLRSCDRILVLTVTSVERVDGGGSWRFDVGICFHLLRVIDIRGKRLLKYALLCVKE